MKRLDITYGFTLIELMVTIGIIGALATVAGTRVYQTIQRNATVAQLKVTLRQIQTMRETANKTVLELTGNTCSDCGCRNGLADSPACKALMTASWTVLGFQKTPNTPFGDIFLNENEGDSAMLGCNSDTLVVYNRYDDTILYIHVPTFTCKPSTKYMNETTLAIGDVEETDREMFVARYRY